jgi:hypothetical protein
MEGARKIRKKKPIAYSRFQLDGPDPGHSPCVPGPESAPARRDGSGRPGRLGREPWAY